MDNAELNIKKLIENWSYEFSKLNSQFHNYSPIFNSKEMIKKISKMISSNVEIKDGDLDELNIGLLAAKSLDFAQQFIDYSQSLHDLWHAFLLFCKKPFIINTNSKRMAYNFYQKQNGFRNNKNKILSHLQGIDFNEKVDDQCIKYKNSFIFQWKLQSIQKGNYYADFNSVPDCVGIHSEQDNLFGNAKKRVKCKFNLMTDIVFLKTTANAAVDTWSIKGRVFMTKGGCYQYFNSNETNNIVYYSTP